MIQDLRNDLGPADAAPTKKEEFATKIKDLEAKFKGQYTPPDKKPKVTFSIASRYDYCHQQNYTIELIWFGLHGDPKKCYDLNRMTFPQLLTETIVLWTCYSQHLSILVDKNSLQTLQ